MSTVNLTARPEAFVFRAHEEKDLRETLADVDRHTLILPIGGPGDVLLNADTGQTTGGYSYSDVALAQVCAMISPGLLQVVQDVYGQWRKPGEDRRYFSVQQAVDVFNRLVKLRFDRKMVGMQFVRDTKRKIIDGLVGARYRYLSNSDFCDRVLHTYDKTGVKFFEGYLYGRQLALRYAFKDNPKYGYDLVGTRYQPGFHFANSEVGGQSVRTASLLIDPSTGYCALGPYRDGSGGRVVHSGRSFEKRLHGLLGTTVNKLPPISEIEGGAALLEARSLHLGGDKHDHNVRHYVTALRRRKLNLGFAKRVVSSASTKGRDETDTLADRMPGERRLVLESRTRYDLFVALIREARDLPLDQRETAEQVAYAILTGKISM